MRKWLIYLQASPAYIAWESSDPASRRRIILLTTVTELATALMVERQTVVVYRPRRPVYISISGAVAF
jgi:hypothetical protein